MTKSVKQPPLKLTQTQIAAIEAKVSRMHTLKEVLSSQSPFQTEYDKIRKELQTIFEGYPRVVLKNFEQLGEYQPFAARSAVPARQLWKSTFRPL